MVDLHEQYHYVQYKHKQEKHHLVVMVDLHEQYHYVQYKHKQEKHHLLLTEIWSSSN